MNVRLSPDVRGRLEKLARQSGLKASDLIRMAVEKYCAEIEEAGTVQITLREISQNHRGKGDNIFSGGGVPERYAVSTPKKKKGG
jgi:predicted DNA-binding protein